MLNNWHLLPVLDILDEAEEDKLPDNFLACFLVEDDCIDVCCCPPDRILVVFDVLRVKEYFGLVVVAGHIVGNFQRNSEPVRNWSRRPRIVQRLLLDSFGNRNHSHSLLVNKFNYYLFQNT